MGASRKHDMFEDGLFGSSLEGGKKAHHSTATVPANSQQHLRVQVSVWIQHDLADK